MGRCFMKRDAKAEGMRWLVQAQADRRGAQLLFDGGSYRHLDDEGDDG